MLSVVNGNKRDAKIDAMLLVQMVGVNSAFVRIVSYLAHSETLEELDCYGRMLNKLARTFIDQREALQRNRAGSEQSVKVQNVSVSEGGQAIVGNVTQPPRENAPDKPAAASPQTLPDARTAPMPIIDKSKERTAVPARETINEEKS
jgi:hypothetical protein